MSSKIVRYSPSSALIEEYLYRKVNYRYCRFLNCNNDSSVPDIHFYKFPKEERRCEEWVKASKNEELIGVPAEKLYKNAYLCSEHFEDWCFMNTVSKHRLVPRAVPCISKEEALKLLGYHSNKNVQNENDCPDQVKNKAKECLRPDTVPHFLDCLKDMEEGRLQKKKTMLIRKEDIELLKQKMTTQSKDEGSISTFLIQKKDIPFLKQGLAKQSGVEEIFSTEKIDRDLHKENEQTDIEKEYKLDAKCRLIDVNFFISVLRLLNKHKRNGGCNMSDLLVVGEKTKGENTAVELRCQVCQEKFSVWLCDPRKDYNLDPTTKNRKICTSPNAMQARTQNKNNKICAATDEQSSHNQSDVHLKKQPKKDHNSKVTSEPTIQFLKPRQIPVEQKLGTISSEETVPETTKTIISVPKTSAKFNVPLVIHPSTDSEHGNSKTQPLDVGSNTKGNMPLVAPRHVQSSKKVSNVGLGSSIFIVRKRKLTGTTVPRVNQARTVPSVAATVPGISTPGSSACVVENKIPECVVYSVPKWLSPVVKLRKLTPDEIEGT